MLENRNFYGTSGNGYTQPNKNGQIFVSPDYGTTWYPTPTFAPLGSPEFPSTAPSNNFQIGGFFQYSAGYSCPSVDNCGTYVYALGSADNTLGVPWNGSATILARATIASLITHYNAPVDSDWQFYCGGSADGMANSSWCNVAQAASPVMRDFAKLGAGQPTYVSACNAYVMFTTSFVTLAQPSPPSTNGAYTDMYMWQAPHPWGPWNKVGSYPATNEGWYWPEIVASSVSGDNAVLLPSGNVGGQTANGT
jgi:hypothetical protein